MNIDLNVYNEALNISQTLGADLSVLQQVKMRGQFKTRDRGLSFDINRLIQSPMGLGMYFGHKANLKTGATSAWSLFVIFQVQ